MQFNQIYRARYSDQTQAEFGHCEAVSSEIKAIDLKE